MISRPIFLNEIENSENLVLLLSVVIYQNRAELAWLSSLLEAMKLKIKKN